jgi:hypothetical protein
VGLKLKGTHQLLAYTDEVSLLGDKIDTVKKNTKTLTDTRKEVVLKIKPRTFFHLICCRKT